jgi:predicted transcriptional regulator
LLGIYEVFVFGLFAGIWLILIGLFLLQAAGQSYSELIVSQELSGKSVKDFLREEFPFVSPNLKVNDFIATHISKREFTSIPVIWDSRIVGYISAEEIERHNIDFSDEVNVMDIMKSYPSDLSIHRTQDSMVALKLMVVNNVTFLPVVARETIEGIITLDDMAKYLIDKKAL